MRKNILVNFNYQKTYTLKEATAKLEGYCAYQERCHKEVNQKLREMRMIPEVVDIIILHLLKYNFLNEKNDTRWAVFSINSIDFKYEAIDINQIWSQAFYLATSEVNTEITSDIKDFCISNSGSHQAVDFIAQIVEDCFEVNEDCKMSATDLFLELPLKYQNLMGGRGTGPIKMGKALLKVFDVKHCYLHKKGDFKK